jgi:hypothetical protein
VATALRCRYRNGVPISSVQRRREEFLPYGGKRSPPIRVTDWREALVTVAAHEFNHIRQYQNHWPRSEADCEKFAAKRLAIYRQAVAAGSNRNV